MTSQGSEHDDTLAVVHLNVLYNTDVGGQYLARGMLQENPEQAVQDYALAFPHGALSVWKNLKHNWLTVNPIQEEVFFKIHNT